jgi:hypothetical protein
MKFINNSDIKPPLPVVDPERFYRPGENAENHGKHEIRNTKYETN